MGMVRTDATDTPRAILALLAEGRSTTAILRQHPGLGPEDIQEAAAIALGVLEGGESRAERIARVRRTHPHAFEPWSSIEDAQLQDEFVGGASVAALSRAFGRPPGAIRQRLERLGVDWRRARKPA